MSWLSLQRHVSSHNKVSLVITPYLLLALCGWLAMKCWHFFGGDANIVSCKLSFKLSKTLPIAFSHTHLFSSPRLSFSCVWERQCLHTMGAQPGCRGNHRTLPHSGRKWALHLWIEAVTRLVEELSLARARARTHTHTQRARLPMTPTPTLCQTNTLKCILFQNGGLGYRGWVPLILEPGTTILRVHTTRCWLASVLIQATQHTFRRLRYDTAFSDAFSESLETIDLASNIYIMQRCIQYFPITALPWSSVNSISLFCWKTGGVYGFGITDWYMQWHLPSFSVSGGSN